MKVGTDAVVLGCLAPISPSTKRILDIGTGSGVIALMLAQRCKQATVIGIEIDEAASKQAQVNFEASIYAEQLIGFHQSLQNYAVSSSIKFDLIVSNPPFFEQVKNARISDVARSLARHDGSLSFSDLAKHAAVLLASTGSFCIILPVKEARLFGIEADLNGLHLTHEMAIIPRFGKPANRLVQVYQFMRHPLVQIEITLKDENGSPSEEYIQLSKEFYLRIDQ